MLSIEDINKELGKNLFIYPLTYCTIKSNSVDLTASKFAWTADDGKYIFDKDKNVIVAPAKKSICILTNEVIYVTSKLGGTYHSRMGLVMKGMGHIGTNLDPGYIGQSLIILHNTSDKNVEIALNERIVSVMFYYLNTPIKEIAHHTTPGHFDKLSSFENYEEFKHWREKNRYTMEKRILVDSFLTSAEFARFKEQQKIDNMRWGSMWDKIVAVLKKYSLKYIVIVVASIAMYLIVSHINGISVPEITQIMCVMLAVFFGAVVGDIKR